MAPPKCKTKAQRKGVPYQSQDITQQTQEAEQQSSDFYSQEPASSQGYITTQAASAVDLSSPFTPLDMSFGEGPPRTPAADIDIHTPTKLQVISATEFHQQLPEDQPSEEEGATKDRPLEDDYVDTGTEGDVSHHGSPEDDLCDDDDGSMGPKRVLPQKLEGRIVEWLQQNRFLYDKTQQGYRNSAKKARAYEEFAASLGMGITGPQLKKWIASKRTQFGRISRKVSKSGAGAEMVTARERFLLQNFEFLRRHIVRHRDTKVLGLPGVS